MADVFSRDKRSSVMSKIRGKGNKKTELVLVSILRSAGITGWRRHLPIFGNPDFCFPKQKLAVFVDGCFWHGCSKHYNVPVNNAGFWAKKSLRTLPEIRESTRSFVTADGEFYDFGSMI